VNGAHQTQFLRNNSALARTVMVDIVKVWPDPARRVTSL
jgi:hypothetical protein